MTLHLRVVQQSLWQGDVCICEEGLFPPIHTQTATLQSVPKVGLPQRSFYYHAGLWKGCCKAAGKKYEQK